MAVVHDASSNGQIVDSGTSLTFSHTCSGSNRYLTVWITKSATQSITGVTYNGTAMTSVANTENVYGLINPTSGAHNIVVSFTPGLSSGKSVDALGESFTGVNQTTAIDISGGTGGGANPSVSVTTTKNNRFLVACMKSPNSITGNGAGQTQVTNYTAGVLDMRITTKLASAAGSNSMSYTVASDSLNRLDVIALNNVLTTVSVVDTVTPSEINTYSLATTILNSVAVTDMVTSAVDTKKWKNTPKHSAVPHNTPKS